MPARFFSGFILSFVLVGIAASGCDGSDPIGVKPGVDGGGGMGASTGGGGGGGSAGQGGGIPGGPDGPRVPPPVDGGPAPRLDGSFTNPDLQGGPAPDRPPAAPPNPEAKLLVGGRARLVGTHLSACSNQVPASGSGDRWCGFTMPHRIPGRTELWVINATKAVAGAVKCDSMNPTADPNCKLLTTELWTSQPEAGPSHPYSHRFDGDTLIFHAKAAPTIDNYRGPIFAWRVGWPEAKQISNGVRAYSCSAHFLAEQVVCIENLTEPTAPPLQFDLTAGKLDTGAQVVARITPTRPNTMSSQWRVTLTRNGQYIVYSTGGKTPAEVETVYALKMDDVGKGVMPTVLLRGASRWQISIDQTKIYYLSMFNYSTEGDPRGVLMMADFPSGMGSTMIADKVGAYQLLFDGTETDKGIGFFDNVAIGKGTFKIARDRANPAMVSTVAANISSALVSRDLRFVYFGREFDQMTGLSDLYIAKTDGSGTCELTNSIKADAFGTPFTVNTSMVFWADQVDDVDGVGQGWYANPDGCTGKKMFAEKIDFWFLSSTPRPPAVATQTNGMLFSDAGEGEIATLKYVGFAGGTTFGTPVLVQRQISRYFAVISGFDAVIYMLKDAAGGDNLYSFAKLPFAGGGSGRDGGM